MAYQVSKGLGAGHYPDKPEDMKVLFRDEVEAILKQIKLSAEEARSRGDEVALRNTRRDHALIFLTYCLGLRVTEAVTLDRTAFRHLDSDRVYIRRLKRRPSIKIKCEGCGRMNSSNKKDLGAKKKCMKCGASYIVPQTITKENSIPDEVPIQAVSTACKEYAKQYLSGLPKDQKYLFQTNRGSHMTSTMARIIFNTYAKKAGIAPQVCFHALRHGTGATVIDATGSVLAVGNVLGHKSLKSAEVYTHISPKQRDEYIKELDKVSIGEKPI